MKELRVEKRNVIHCDFARCGLYHMLVWRTKVETNPLQASIYDPIRTQPLLLLTIPSFSTGMETIVGTNTFALDGTQ